MSDTIEDLYNSFSEQMEPIQEDDRYFRYLFEMAQASDTTLEQKREELVKVIDEEWISMIEDSLDAINAIIEKPRRFITTEEEVVPVSLAKKISADSVRHLSQNTQFIAQSDDGGIHPTKILNVNTVETYDLYENRFIYHLIQRLLTFVDKRTDVIFWSTGNEIQNHLKMHSKIGDAYEEIEYTVDMTVKNRQSFAENDADNMETFMRIDRVRRLVMALRNASFCQIMAGCAAVRSPIQRTNLIMKDPNYRKCYQLWQFMERYDSVGYTIDVKDSALAFDDEYMVQMYTNLINNYTVFKSLTSDDRNLEELASVHRDPVTPKFVKEIKEEIVDSPDIPDVEVRRVFVEEVTQAQLDAEAALERERAEREELEGQLKAWKMQVRVLTDERDDLADELDEANAREQALEERAHAAEAAARKAKDALADVEGALREAENDAARAREEAARELERVEAESSAEVAAAKADADARVAATQEDAAAQIAAAQEKAAAAQADAQAQVAAAKESAESRVAEARKDAQAQVAKAQEEAKSQVAAAKADAESQIAVVHDAAEAAAAKAADELAAAHAAHRAEVEQLRTEADAAARAAEDAAAQAARQAAQELADAKDDMGRRIAELEDSLAQAERARVAAERRAEGNSLSRYLLAKLRGQDASAPDDAGEARPAGEGREGAGDAGAAFEGHAGDAGDDGKAGRAR